MKKTFAVLLSVVMIIAMLPLGVINAIPATNEQQIISTGGQNTTDCGDVTVSKTVAPTEDENYFDITLQVTKALPSTDVVLVMDISNTMNSDHYGHSINDSNYNVKVEDTRIYKAKAAAKEFLREYSVAAGISDDRRIGMVQFNSDVSKVFDLTNVKDSVSSLESKIDAIVAPTGDRRFTNIEGGIQLAANLLKDSTAAKKYIVLITDGFPTTYIESGKDSTESITGYTCWETTSAKPSAAGDGVFYDFVANKPILYGTNYSDTAARKAQILATSLKNDGYNIYSVGIDISSESQTIQKYIDSISSSNSTVERTSSSYAIGSATDATAYVNWLGKSIGGGEDLADAGVTNAFAKGDTVEELQEAFATVLDHLAGATPMSVSDPMGGNVEFLGFYDKSGAQAGNSLSGSYAQNTENTASYKDEITWKVSESGYTQTEREGVTYRTFTLTYKVRLTNEVSGFVAEKEYKTNGTTTLKYRTLLLADTDPDLVIEFPVPSVEGYLGGFSFTKLDSADEPVAGAGFTLTHASDCSVCGGKVSIKDFTATTSSNGAIAFSGIPSGHIYNLTETAVPDGIVIDSTPRTVEVAYGVTYLDGEEITADETIKNELFASVVADSIEGDIVLTENGENKEVKDGQFSVTVTPDEGNNPKGYKMPDETVVSADENGNFTIEGVEFTRAGEYTFTLTENNDGAEGYDYDGGEYKVIYTVEPDEQTGSFKITNTEITKNGEPVDGIEFVNSYTTPDPVSVDIEGIVTLTGGGKTSADITDGFFEYVVTGSEQSGVSGVPAQADVAQGGGLDLGTWTFTEEGEYTFTVTENVPPAGYKDETGTVTVTVTVTLNEVTNTFETNVVYSTGAELKIDNIYTYPDSISVILSGTKTLTENGEDKVIKDGQFSFELSACDENEEGAELPEETEVSAAADGTFAFGAITFSKPGTYSFDVTETDKGAAGYGYDSAVYTVTYNVILDTADNTFKVESISVEKDGEQAESVEFSNTYETPLPVSIDVPGVTTLTGGGKTNDDITAGFFGYTVSGGEQTGVANVPESTVTAAGGELDFGTWSFSEVGEYTFTINENTPPAGYTDITGEVTVTVTITLNEETNTLEADVVYSTGEIIKIDNIYTKPDPVNVALNGEVTLGGQKTNADIGSGDFVFTVTPDEANKDDYTPYPSTVNVKEGGDIDFTNATFTEEGTYVFTVAQKDKGRVGYVYDDTVFTVTVTVTLDTDTNEYVTETVISCGDSPAKEIVFANTYIPVPVSVSFGAERNIDGYPLQDSEFVFVLAADDAAYPMPAGSANGILEVKFTGEGKFNVGTLEFTQAGVYTYTFSETPDDVPGYTYDDTVYVIEITVKDISGYLRAYTGITVDGEKADKLYFDNIYDDPYLNPPPSDGPVINPDGGEDAPPAGDDPADKPSDGTPDEPTVDDGSDDTTPDGDGSGNNDAGENDGGDAEENTGNTDTDTDADTDADTDGDSDAGSDSENKNDVDLPFTGSNDIVTVAVFFIMICAIAVFAIAYKKKING